MESQTYLSQRFNEMLFEDRNKSYGAYVIRRSYDRTMVLAVSISLLLMLLLSFGSRIAGSGSSGEDETDEFVKSTVITIQKPEEKPKKPIIEERKKTNEVKKGPDVNQQSTPVVAAKPQDTIPVAAGQPTRKNGLDTLTGPPGDPTQPIVKADTSGHGPATVVDANGGCDEPPTCPSLLGFLRSNISYPAYCKDNGIQGTVWIEFIVETDGRPSEVKIVRGVHRLLDQEALRVAAKMPVWTPCSVKGSKARARYMQPIRFVLR